MDAAYVAGILDGEGCLTVGLNKAKKTYDARVYVGMTEKAIGVLQRLHNQYGGSLRKSREATEEWGAAWMWCLCGKEAAAMLRDAAPHLVLKDRQARLLLELEDMKPGGRNSWTNEMRVRAAGIRATVMDLNRKGPDSPRPEPPIPGASFVRDVDGMLMSPKQPDLFSDSEWQPWCGPFGNAGISEPGGFWMLNTSDSPSADDGFSACFLADVLEPSVAPKYSLSAKACAGILRRAAKRGKELPDGLRTALQSAAQDRQMKREAP